jgi:hypothetical protein
LLAQLHAPDLAYHFHGDHLLALLLKYSAGQLNTLVNFESALLGLDGQFSVGGNIQHAPDHIVGVVFCSRSSLLPVVDGKTDSGGTSNFFLKEASPFWHPSFHDPL